MAAVRLLEQGVEELGADTQFGGEAQLWLALSYQVGVGRKLQLPRGGGWPAGDHACTGIGLDIGGEEGLRITIHHGLCGVSFSRSFRHARGSRTRSTRASRLRPTTPCAS